MEKKLSFFLLVFIVLWPFGGYSEGCNESLRTEDYRRPPEFGIPKTGIVDYKLINQLLLGLRSAILGHEPLPEGFVAELVPPSRLDSPIGGVLLRGKVAWPKHPLFGHFIELEIQRERLAVVAKVRDLTQGNHYQLVIDVESFSSVFPFQRPAGRGSLLSLAKGLEVNFLRFESVEQ